MRDSSAIIQAVPQMRKRLQKQKSRPRVKQKASIHLSFDKIFAPHVRTKQLSEFTRQLATLLQARLQLTRSLEILADQSPNKRFKKTISEILVRINEGHSLSNCMTVYPKAFNDFFISLVEVGEKGGILPQTLNRLATYLEKLTHLQRKILTALTYPTVIILVAVGAITFLLAAVVPTFADMFHDFGGELPGATQFLLNLGNFVKKNFGLLTLSVVILVFFIIRLTKTARGAIVRDKLLLKIPIIGGFLKKSFLTKFCETLGTLLTSGVTLVKSLEVTEKISKNQVFKAGIREMKERIIQGQTMLPQNRLIEPFTALTMQMIRLGEETGELAETLDKVAGFYEAELDAAIDAMTSIIEPVIIVFLGLILGGTLIAMYLQLFNLVNVIQ